MGCVDDGIVACAYSGERWVKAERLSETNLLVDASSASETDEAYLDRLNRVELKPGAGFEISVSPFRSLNDLEVWIYESVDRLHVPLVSAKCFQVCDAVGVTASAVGEQQRLRLDPQLVDEGRVIVVSSFVQSAEEMGQISWGFEIGPQEGS
jgi:hypothetical protein